jgi:hypothetical protein
LNSLSVPIHHTAYRKCALDLVTGTNLARACGINENQTCPAYQSSTLDFYYASIANDGSLGAGFSHTLGAPGVCGPYPHDMIPWWMLDFGRTRSIFSGKIWGRTSYQSRLDGFQIWVGDSSTAYNAYGNSKCYTAYTIEHYQPPYTHIFSCAGSGRYIFVVLPSGQCLSLTEVEIYPPSGPGKKNIFYSQCVMRICELLQCPCPSFKMRMMCQSRYDIVSDSQNPAYHVQLDHIQLPLVLSLNPAVMRLGPMAKLLQRLFNGIA